MCYMVLVGLFGLVLPAPWGYWGHKGQPGYQVAHAYVTVLFPHNCGKLPGPAYLRELPVPGGTVHTVLSAHLRELPVPGGTVHTVLFQHTCGNCPSQVAQYTQYFQHTCRKLPVPGGTVHTVLFQHTCGNCPSQVAQYTQYSSSTPAGTARPRWHSTHSTLSAHLRELPVPGGTVHTVLFQHTCGNCPSQVGQYTQYSSSTPAGTARPSKWPPDDDWPWIPFYYYNVAWERTEAVLKIIYFDVQVGEGNPNRVECVIKGQTYPVEVIVKACPIGRFGRICMERCQCYNGASCHSFNGACKCAPGWIGRHCTIENPEVRISPSSSELTDLRYGQELHLTCTGYNFPIANITWFFENDVSKTEKSPEVKDRNSTHLNISSLLPQYEGHVTCEAVSTSGEKYNDAVDIRIAGCQDNLYGERCDQTCDCTGLATCNRTLGCVCPEGVSGDGCPRPEDADTQFTLLVVSLTSSGVVILLVIVIILLHRQNNRLRVGPVNDPEIFKLGQKIQAVMPRERGPSSSSIDMDMLKEREIDRGRLQIGQLLGEGAFGHAVKATLEQPEGGNVVVAVKKLKADNAETTARTDLLRETCIMLLCGDHDNVIGLKGICFRDGPLQLVLEYAEHGSLLHLLWTLRAESKLNRTVLVNKRHIFENMMVGVCCGLEHLASQRLVHRDIAARNILICGKGTAKIADFGLARDTYAVGYHRQDRGNELLPLKWIAPEGLKNEAMVTHKSDVWSFGVLLWEVAQLGRTPYPGMDGADRIYDALRNHFRLPRPQLCTEERYQLMLKCWKFNEKRRPDATTVRKQLEADPNGFFYFNVPTAAIEAAAPVTPV
ncbi:hypothetical protein Bbelb_156710 [Branchiostoma belcheri]|nr:hypothetical protein Bbelb_156710 [Branchiostoma belcheri]